MNALVYVDIDQGIHKGKNESCSKWKTKKTTWVFFLYEYRKFWSVSLEFKLERKTFILDVSEISQKYFDAWKDLLCQAWQASKYFPLISECPSVLYSSQILYQSPWDCLHHHYTTLYCLLSARLFLLLLHNPPTMLIHIFQYCEGPN